MEVYSGCNIMEYLLSRKTQQWNSAEPLFGLQLETTLLPLFPIFPYIYILPDMSSSVMMLIGILRWLWSLIMKSETSLAIYNLCWSNYKAKVFKGKKGKFTLHDVMQSKNDLVNIIIIILTLNFVYMPDFPSNMICFVPVCCVVLLHPRQRG